MIKLKQHEHEEGTNIINNNMTKMGERLTITMNAKIK
jgi:hypothetical protein